MNTKKQELDHLGRLLATLREQASRCSPGPFKEMILAHARKIQAHMKVYESELGVVNVVSLPEPAMTETQATQITNEILSRIMKKG